MIVAVDTETFRGRAILITKPDSFVEPETWEDCVDFIAGDRETACYNMDYDVQACLKYLPHKILERLALLHKATFFVGPREYTVHYVPHKFCKIWEEGKLRTTVYDIAQFYNCTLKKALERNGLPGKKELPESWYKNMLKRLKDPKTREQVLRYALNDARGLQDLIRVTEEAFSRAGMKFERPMSNASFSQRVFQDALTRKGVTREVDKIARPAYFGGRIECLKIGFFRRAYYYDIHSAYPSIIAQLTTPNGKWITDERHVRGDASYVFADCTLEIPDTTVAGPVAFRLRSNRIVYPVGTFRRVLTKSEYLYCERKGYIKTIHSVYQHIWGKVGFPFKKVRDLYLQRQLNPAQSYAIKIVLNALYGKTAQMLKDRLPVAIVDHTSEWISGQPYLRKEKRKHFTNFVYASEITSRVRMKLLEDIPPEKVIFYATDGVMCTEPIPGLDIGPGLGQWSKVEEVSNLVVIGSGVYEYTHVDDGERTRVTKFRGFTTRFKLRPLLRRAGRKRVISLRVLRNTSLRQAVLRPEDLNVLEKIERRLDLNFDAKRFWPRMRNAEDLLKHRFDSEPLVYYGKLKIRR